MRERRAVCVGNVTGRDDTDNRGRPMRKCPGVRGDKSVASDERGDNGLSDSSGGPLPFHYPTVSFYLPVPSPSALSFLHQLSHCDISTQEVCNSLVTPLKSQASMGSGDHLYSGDSSHYVDSSRRRTLTCAAAMHSVYYPVHSHADKVLPFLLKNHVGRVRARARRSAAP
ncbi:hypothetical protein EVAR_90721_1 [Eumeta japonica]|uniref:Uncharacterized protein n=1 Tax=Eumeta variegata TaxID=151549 RepID=A0A4C1ZD10_EUMVA|nr:hypothetical protein EVAR_90721_1 [Eumeta japonica]